jgi:hypothetical protein
MFIVGRAVNPLLVPKTWILERRETDRVFRDEKAPYLVTYIKLPPSA